MKKFRTCLVAAALGCSVFAISASAAPFSITVYEGNTALPGYQSSCEFSLQDFLKNCPDAFLPNCPDFSLPDLIPGLPGGNQNQTPDLPDVEVPPSEGDDALSSYETEVVRLVNEARAENGLQPLTASAEISRVARVKSQDMADNGYFSHTSPTYGTPFQMLTTFGITYKTAGENIAYGQRTPQEVVTGWLNSPGHRANILNASFTQIGVGYVAAGNYWTQLFIG